MEADGVFQVDERSIVEKAGRDGEISQRGRAELVPISLIAGDLFKAEILVFPRPREYDIALPHAEVWRDLRHADDTLLKVTEHLVRLACNSVAADTSCVAEEQQCP